MTRAIFEDESVFVPELCCVVVSLLFAQGKLLLRELQCCDTIQDR